MQKSRPQVGDVTYNAARQSFEALVNFYTPSGRVRIASELVAPITEDFDSVAEGLWRDALKRRHDPNGLRARFSPRRAAQRHEMRARIPVLKRFLNVFTGRAAA